jgi:hypothetical protein
MPNGRWVVVEPAAAPLPLLPPGDAASEMPAASDAGLSLLF